MYRNVFQIFYIPFDVVKKEAKDSFLQTASHHMKYSDSIVLAWASDHCSYLSSKCKCFKKTRRRNALCVSKYGDRTFWWAEETDRNENATCGEEFQTVPSGHMKRIYRHFGSAGQFGGGPKQIKTVFCLTKRVVKVTKGRTRDYYLYHWCGLFSILGIARQEDGNVNSGNFCPENIPILRFIFVSSSHSGGGGVVSGFQGLISHRLSWFFVCAVWQCFTT